MQQLLEQEGQCFHKKKLIWKIQSQASYGIECFVISSQMKGDRDGVLRKNFENTRNNGNEKEISVWDQKTDNFCHVFM